MAAVVLVAAGVRCYKPNVQDGGLLCADAGTKCPEGFQCHSDGRCHSGPEQACQASVPHINPICTGPSNSPCDPVCQSGCPCGRCNLVGKALMCTPPGSKQAGDLCNAASDDCAAGNVCLNDCGGGVARCFRYCGVGSNINQGVCQGQACDVPVDDAIDGGATNLTVCEPPAKPCTNPVGDSGECGSSALGCYITSTGETVCDCKGAGLPGTGCGPYNSCIAGYRCIQIGAAKCFQTCAIGGMDCPASQVCKPAPGSPNFGYCDAP